jgi:L-ascorbate metabolism protein UlaG (beta-lactamase superfamily)
MKWPRRKFLLTGALGLGSAVAGGSVWLSYSRRRSARMLRQFVTDIKRGVKPAPVAPAPAQWDPNKITVCWLGHATYLLDFYGLNILTDPVFSSRVGINLGLATLGPKRYVATALRFSQLPPIDVVLLSHAHMDHLDLPSLRRFKQAAFTVTAAATRELLVGTNLRNATELRWGDHATFKSPKGDLRIEAFEVKHWGRRWPSEAEYGYSGYVLTREGRSIIFGGDTAYTETFRALRPRGPYELAIMPIAAYNPWIRNHCTPEQALTMANMAGAMRFAPMHHQTFKLSEEPLEEPLARLERALQSEPERLVLRRAGESISLA